MELSITPLKAGDKPQPEFPDNRILEILGEDGIRAMISDHYDLLIQSEVKDLFPSGGEELANAKQYAADFIIQRFGGPDYYAQHRGKPLLIKRHAPFKITSKARVVWLECYRKVLLEREIPEEVLIPYWKFLDVFSNWMVNTEENANNYSNLKLI